MEWGQSDNLQFLGLALSFISYNRWEANNFASAEHMGTHIDAPVHINPEGKPLDQIPLEDLLAPLIIINTREQVQCNCVWVEG